MIEVFEYNGKRALETRQLWENGIIAERALAMRIQRAKGTSSFNVLQRSNRGIHAVIEYDSLSFDIRQKIEKLTIKPVVTEVETKTLLQQTIVENNAAHDFFEKYKQEQGKDWKPEKVTELYNNAKILTAMVTIIDDAQRKQDVLGPNRNKVSLAKLVEDLKMLNIMHSLPTSERNLRPLINKFRETGSAALLHGNEKNQNKRKVTPEILNLMLSVFCMKNKPYESWVKEDIDKFFVGEKDIVNMETGEVLNRFDYIDKNGELPSISESTCRYYINLPENQLLCQSIRNPNYFNGSLGTHYSFKLPEYSLSMVTFDDINLQYKTAEGKNVKAYLAYDVASGACIGVAISKKKDEALFLDCMRDTILTCNKYGLGLPMEPEVEHHICGNFKDTLLMSGFIFQNVRFCEPGNSKEKYAETCNRILKYQFHKRLIEDLESGRHYAKNLTNRTGDQKVWDEKREEYVAKEKIFTYEEVVANFMYVVEQYNNSPKPGAKETRIEYFKNHANPKAWAIDFAKLAPFIGDEEKTSICRFMYFSYKREKYILSNPAILGKLASNNYEIIAYKIGELPQVYIYQNDKLIDTCLKMEKPVRGTAEWTDKDTAAQTVQAKYIESLLKTNKERKNNLIKSKFTQLIDYSDIKPIEAEVVTETDELSEDYLLLAMNSQSEAQQRAANDFFN